MGIKSKKLKIYLSEDRINKYIKLANKDIKKAIFLYRENKKYCQKFYIALYFFEIVLRNAVNNQLITDFELNWYDCEKINFTKKQSQIISKSKNDIRRDNKKINNSNVITGLTFGFWCHLFNSEYDKVLWRTSLYKIFRNLEIAPKRSNVRERLQKFKKIRNRIAHCECIIQLPVKKYYNNLIEFLDWIDEDMAKWVKKEVNFK